MSLAGVALAMPQGAVRDNTFTKILSFESYQDGNNFGHELFQEDGTTAGQKFGPDGLLYGFYSYLQEDGNRVKVLWRAGEGVGYEVIGVEGLNKDNLGNLRATPPRTQHRAPAPAPAPVRQAPVRQAPRPVVTQQPHHQRQVPVVPVVQQRVPTQAQRLPPRQNRFMPTPSPILPEEPTPAPHRFDYPAVLNLERTGSGFISSLLAV